MSLPSVKLFKGADVVAIVSFMDASINLVVEVVVLKSLSDLGAGVLDVVIVFSENWIIELDEIANEFKLITHVQYE